MEWIGGNAGDWFTPTNWNGGALPDNNNVAAVVFPQAVSITSAIPFNLGDTSITANGSSFSLETHGGLVTGKGAIQVPAGTLSLNTHSPMVIGSGGLTAASDITLQAATADADSTITLSGPISTSSDKATLAAFGNITVTSTATTTSASDIAYAAPAGNIAVTTSSFSGATPVLTGSTTLATTPLTTTPPETTQPATTPPTATPTETTPTETIPLTTHTIVSAAQQQTSIVVNQFIQTATQPEAGLVRASFTLTQTTDAVETSPTVTNAAVTTKEEEEKKAQNQTASTSNTQESPADQPADNTQQGGNIVQLLIGNTSIRKTVDQIVEANVPKTRTLVCR